MINSHAPAAKELAKLDTVKIDDPSVENSRFVMLTFTGFPDKMLLFAADAHRFDLQRPDCGMEGVELLIEYNKIWVVMNEEEYMLLSLKYRDYIGCVRDLDQMRTLVAPMAIAGNSNIFLMACVIGFVS